MQSMKKYYLAMTVLAVVSLGAVVWHYAISRGAAEDDRKVRDITSLRMAVDNYYQEKGDLPTSLSDLSLDDDVAKRLPKYEYSHTNDSYTLCATFANDLSADGAKYASGDSEPYYHKKGRQCFTSEVTNYDFYDSSNNPRNFLNNYDTLYQ